ncbi:hypothetical protein EJB05_22997 [Eragrostis curvula]|uniref:Uncharacterized protein n=1 Tax=Eragrostis curvula TaxID=38414 RepID=A0A5J9V5U5_9POAL|nr:hypothetical protein EJB05_22997 [Eragrostis curvula]
MAAASGYLVFFLLLAVVACKVADAADGEALSVVIGQAKCTDCTRKNMKAEAVFKDLQVVIKCNNSHGEFEHTAVGSMDSSGAFSIPLATDVVQGADCFAQLNSAEGTPCYGQEPSWIHPFSKSTYVAYAGKVHSASAQCSAVLWGWLKQHFQNHKQHFYNHFLNGGSPSPAPAN